MRLRKGLTRLLCALLAVLMLAGTPSVTAEAAVVEQGIDVSKWQGVINWPAVAQSGMTFAFIRVGNTKKGLDEYFYYNMLSAQAVGLKTGVYIYSYATNVQEAAIEAQFVLNAVQNLQVSYPIVWDVEDDVQANLSADTLSLMANTFCAIIEAEGYYPMVYSNKYWFTNKIGTVYYDKWVAQWGTSCDIADAAVWQYSETGVVAGIEGNVDLDFALKDYSADIVNTGWVARKGFWYFYINYKMQRGWLDLGSAKYYLDGYGRMVTGWLQLEDGIYYFQSDGTMATGFTLIGTGIYYFDSAGRIQTGWQTIDGVTFLFSDEGPMVTGWFNDGQYQYYLSAEDGHMVTGFYAIDNQIYCFDANGHMITGVVTINGYNYYFDASGVMQTGLVEIDGLPYYFDEVGRMIDMSTMQPVIQQ